MHSEIIMLTDVSGSMNKIDRATCEGFNSFIAEQQGVPGTANVTYIRFNTFWTVDYCGPIEKMSLLRSLAASGGTALYDSLVEVINKYRQQLRHTDAQVIFVILTDGEDLNSRRHNARSCATHVNAARADGWQFVFLGANIDAEETANSLGIDRSLAYQFTASDAGTRVVYAQASATTRAMRSWGL